ncbi:TPA: hypothetical protein MJA52_001935 [Klebsiella aerogenes]|nr:hypothetical protein [Klebsiella aerogenes]
MKKYAVVPRSGSSCDKSRLRHNVPVSQSENGLATRNFLLYASLTIQKGIQREEN